MERARAAYETGTGDFDPDTIATVDFAAERGGYNMGIVDEALDRLADAFALKKRDESIDAHGEDAWIAGLLERADVLEERLRRPAGERFAPGPAGEPSYDRADVDALCDQLLAYFTESHPMSVDDVRRAAFRRRKGADGYSEAVVDVYLDHVARLMASVP
nr:MULTISPECIES: DivIVA domain-containing protein [Helcobacillus]